ncbi:hypothetical protein BCS42_12485 [Crenothrix sp. D3]|nr:hypothetical protein BCS42_12485 [Crenothrix sp. D3]
MKNRIFEICNQLVEKGIKPTLITVRTELGGGSFSTINPLLQQWKEERKINGSHTSVDLRYELASINSKAMEMMLKVSSDHCDKIKKEQADELLELRKYKTQADISITKLRKELDKVKKEKRSAGKPFNPIEWLLRPY